MTAAQTPEELNAQLLARIVELEQQYAAHQALRNADAEQLAADFLRVYEALVAAAKR